MSQRKILTLFIYTILLLFIGRNLTFIPTWHGLAKEKDFSETLKLKTEELLSDKKGSYSIYYKNLTRDESFEINSHMIHTGASVNKVPIVVTLYVLSEEEDIDLDEQITTQEQDIQDYGTGILRYQEPGQTYSLQSLAKLALKHSDNTAAHVLTNRIGEGIIQNTIERIGLTQTSIAQNKTSAKDMGILFEKLYSEEILDQAHTKEVLGFLTDTDIEDRIPATIPDATVYHKTGDGVGSLHDVGIIQHGNTVFFLGVMTSDIGNTEEQTKQTIAEIAGSITKFLQEHQ